MTIGFLVFFVPEDLSPAESAFGSGSVTTRTSFFESGDQSKSSTPPFSEVIFSASPPVRGNSQTWEASLSSSRLERKARYLPSGLQRGEDSDSLLVVRRVDSWPSQRVIQISEVLRSSLRSGVRTLYATQVPSGDICGSETDFIRATSSRLKLCFAGWAARLPASARAPRPKIIRRIDSSSRFGDSESLS